MVRYISANIYKNREISAVQLFFLTAGNEKRTVRYIRQSLFMYL